MYQPPIAKMVCDSDYGDGGIYFYETYFEWVERNSGKNFKVEYQNIVDVSVVQTHKKTVRIKTKAGNTWNLYLYKFDELLKILYKQMEGNKKNNNPEVVDAVVEPVKQESDLDKLERLAKLHESGALTDEEFKLAKDKILR